MMLYECLIRPLAVRVFGEPLLINLVVLQYLLDHPEEDVDEWIGGA